MTIISIKNKYDVQRKGKHHKLTPNEAGNKKRKERNDFKSGNKIETEFHFS